MATKAKHAFGALERVDESIKSGIVDAYDVLFVKDSEGKPYVGWVSKDGVKEIVDPYSYVAEAEAKLETELATKANASDIETLESQIATKADSSDIEDLATEVAKKVDAETVQTMIEEHSESIIEVVEF